MARSVLRAIRDRGAGKLIHLHKQATTMKLRATIRASAEPASVLAARYGSLEDQKTIQ